MLSDDNLSFLVGGSQCSAKLIKSQRVLFVSNMMLVMIQRWATWDLKLAWDKVISLCIHNIPISLLQSHFFLGILIGSSKVMLWLLVSCCLRIE